MDISSISGISMVEEANPYVEANAKTVDRDAFIKMFLAQMKNQDPMNPMDGSEFAAQLAQFSSLEQLYNVNESLDDLKTLQENGTQYEMLSLMGKDITATGNAISLSDEGSAMGGFELTETASCSVLISDATGAAVRSLSLGYLEAGTHEFSWDGNDAAGNTRPEGVYSFKVTAVTPDGDQATVTRQIIGQVDRISLQGGTSTLYVGGIPVDLSSVLDIRSAHVETTDGSDMDGESAGDVAGI